MEVEEYPQYGETMRSQRAYRASATVAWVMLAATLGLWGTAALQLDLRFLLLGLVTLFGSAIMGAAAIVIDGRAKDRAKQSDPE